MKAALLFTLFLAFLAVGNAGAASAARLIALDGPLAAGVPQCIHRFA